MEDFATYILEERDLSQKMLITYYLSKKTGIFFDKSIVLKTEIAKLLLENQVLTSCLIGTNIGVKAEDDNFIKQLYRKVLKDFTDKLKTCLADEKRISGEKRDILLDIYDFSLEKYLTYKINSLGYKVFDEYEKENFANGVADFNEIFFALDEAEKSFEEINKNADYLWKKYRDGIVSSGGLMEAEKTRRKTLVLKIKQSIEANRGCGVLYLDTVTPDGFGSPKMKIKVKYAGENTESELYFGSVKPEAVTFDLGGANTIRFAMKNKPVEYVILESFGEDSIFVSSARLLLGGVKYSVCNAEKTRGKVINEQNITKCDTTFAELGESSGIAHLNDVSLAKKPNGVKIFFDKTI